MKLDKQKQFIGLFLTGMILSFSTLAIAQADTAVNRTIIGVWIGQLQRRDCLNNNPIGPVSPGIISFQKGGTVSSASTLPAQPMPLPSPFLQTSGYGIWQQQSAFEYKASIVLMKLNSDGTFSNFTKLRGVIELSDSGDQFSWVGGGEFVAADGTVSLVTCNTITGNRFE